MQLDCEYPMEAKLQLRTDVEGTLVNSTEYRCIIENLRYLTHTCPDFSYDVGMVSRYMEKPTMMHHQAVKHFLRYMKETTSNGLKYQKGWGLEELVDFTDSDLARDIDDRKNNAGTTFYLNQNLISLQSQK